MGRKVIAPLAAVLVVVALGLCLLLTLTFTLYRLH